MSLSGLDADVFHLVNRTLQADALDPVMVFITKWNILIMLVICIFIFRRDGKKAVAPFVLSVAAFVLADLTGDIIKHLVQRVRPCNALEGVHLLVHCGSSFSMPSNHAVNTFAAATPFYFFTESRLKHLLLLVAILVAYSRPYVGVHYPGDVLAGALYGAAFASCLTLGYIRLQRKLSGDGPFLVK